MHVPEASRRLSSVKRHWCVVPENFCSSYIVSRDLRENISPPNCRWIFSSHVLLRLRFPREGFLFLFFFLYNFFFLYFFSFPWVFFFPYSLFYFSFCIYSSIIFPLVVPRCFFSHLFFPRLRHSDRDIIRGGSGTAIAKQSRRSVGHNVPLVSAVKRIPHALFPAINPRLVLVDQ